jgi:hypothetical protein
MKAYDSSDNTEVVIKFAANLEVTEEIEALQKIAGNPHVIPLKDIFKISMNGVYLIMCLHIKTRTLTEGKFVTALVFPFIEAMVPSSYFLFWKFLSGVLKVSAALFQAHLTWHFRVCYIVMVWELSMGISNLQTFYLMDIGLCLLILDGLHLQTTVPPMVIPMAANFILLQK